MRRTTTLALVLVTALACSGCFNWTQYGGTAGRTSNNPHETKLTTTTISGLHELWSSPIVSGRPLLTWGSRVIVDSGEQLSGLSLPSGSVVWQHPADPGSEGRPFVRDGLLYTNDFTYRYEGTTAVDCNGALRARSTATGERQPDDDVLVWDDGTCKGPASESVVTSKHAYVSSTLLGNASLSNYTVAYDWETGAARELPRAGDMAVDEASGLLIVVEGSRVSALRIADDSVVWQRDLVVYPPRSSSLVVQDGSVYLTSGGGTGESDHVQVLDLDTGDDIWSGGAPEEADPGKPAVRADGTAYVTGYRQLFAYSDCGAAECQPVWTSELGDPAGGWSEPTVAGDLVYMVARKVEGVSSELLVFAADGCGQPTCEPLARLTVDGEAGTTLGPVVIDGKVLVQTLTGIHAFGVN